MPETIEEVLARYGFVRQDDGQYLGHRMIVTVDRSGKIGLWTVTGRQLGRAFDSRALARLLDTIL